MKVLMSAFACSPGAGSEPGAGWNWLLQISRQNEVWLLTNEEGASRIEKEAPANVHVTSIPSYRTWVRLKLSNVPGLDWLYYYWWQWKAYRMGRKLHKKVHFDLAHHVTFHTWRIPSFLSLLPVRFIWGPIGGGESVPKSLRKELSQSGRVLEAVRDLSQLVSLWDPAVRLTMRRASAIIVVNRDTAELIPGRWHSKVLTISGVALTGEEAVQPILPDESKPGFLVVSVGLLEPRKGGALTLRAFQKVASSRKDATLVFTSRGPEMNRLAALAKELGIADRVRFLGGVGSRAQVLGWIRSSSVLVLPSLRDSGGLVLLEAMMQERPVVCLDIGGPGEIVTDECGIKIRAGARDQIVADLASAIERLASDPALCQTMGQAGRRRAQSEFLWNRRGEQMMKIYNDVWENRMAAQQ
jgi:glycosyltransferase involved in cell wall biosynthesis